MKYNVAFNPVDVAFFGFRRVMLKANDIPYLFEELFRRLALNRLVGDSITEGRFYQTAGMFDNILNDKNSSPREKAAQIAEVIEKGISKPSDTPQS